jgi:hypothetical protein
MNYKTLENFLKYKIYEDGTIYNTELKEYIKPFYQNLNKAYFVCLKKDYDNKYKQEKIKHEQLQNQNSQIFELQAQIVQMKLQLDILQAQQNMV